MLQFHNAKGCAKLGGLKAMINERPQIWIYAVSVCQFANLNVGAAHALLLLQHVWATLITY